MDTPGALKIGCAGFLCLRLLEVVGTTKVARGVAALVPHVQAILEKAQIGLPNRAFKLHARTIKCNKLVSSAVRQVSLPHQRFQSHQSPPPHCKSCRHTLVGSTVDASNSLCLFGFKVS